MIPGETDPARKTIFFPIYTSDGLLASGGPDPNYEGTLATAAGATLQWQHNRDTPVAALGAFGHVGNGEFYYVFDDTEVQDALSEGTVAFIYAKAGFRTQVMRVPFEYPRADLQKWLGTPPAALTANGFVQAALLRWLTDDTAGTPLALAANLVQIDQTGIATVTDLSNTQTTILAAIPSALTVRDTILDAIRSAHVITGSIGEAISIAASLLQGNFYMDTVVNGENGQTSARMRCFHTGAAAAAATPNGVGEGEFATFVVATTYSGPNKIIDHRVVQQ